MNDWTMDGILRSLVLLAGLCGVITALWSGLDALRKLTGKPRRDAERTRADGRIAALESRLAQCEERLRRGDRRFHDMHADLTQTLTVLNALLMHEITGNSLDRLKTVKSGLDAYLSGRQTKGEDP